ncbi:MAG: BTAD domain-containing putative transcriptional regulator, partial [Rubrobacteraceae bacterium]
PGYAFESHPDCEVDAWSFEEHRQKAEGFQRAEKYDEAIEEYRAALDLFGGGFLAEDVYEEWAAEAREEWRETRLSVLSELSECLALRGRYTEAIEACERAMDDDGYREDFHRRLMLFHYCAGEQTHALRAYRHYARTMKEELGASPSPEMENLKEGIEARDVPGVDEARRYPKPRRPLKFPYSLSRTHFVGRDAEYALLAERLREAGEGSGGAVAVEGEAGVGKTRLVEEFIGYARSRGVRVFSGRCYERDLGPPLEPISEALGPLEDIGVQSPGRSGSSHWGAAMREDGAEIYHSFTAKLIRESRDGGSGIVLFVDDVQWADAATLDFLSYAARRVSGERILIVMTYRREDAPGLSAWLDRFADRRTITLLSLDRLSREDTMELLGRMSSRAFGGVGVLADFLHRESEGNPFYTVEYLRWLIEAGSVHIDSRRRISGMDGEALREGTLPSGVRSLLRARFAALDEEARNVLKTAAVIGRRFDPELLSKAAFLDEDEALRAIEPLTRSGLVAEVSEEYHFSHDKLRQTLYEDIGGRERRKLHLRVAGAIEEAGGEPAELAHHYARARAWRPALDNLILAAKKAEDGYAWENALQENARALEVMEKLPEPDEETRFEILKARENLLEHMDRQEERAATVEEMFALAKRLGGAARIAEVHVRRIGVLMALPDTEGATEAGREAVSIFRGLGDKAGEARAHRELGYARWMCRDYGGALEANFQAIRIHRELGRRRGEAGDAGNIAHAYRGMRDYDNALRWNEEAIHIDRELGDKLGEAFRLNSMALIERERGNLEAALSLNLESIPLLAELGAKNLSATQHVNSGTLHMSLGSPEEALEHFRAALRLSRETGYVRDEGYALMSIGAALEKTGDPKGAAHSYRRAVELLQRAYE